MSAEQSLWKRMRSWLRWTVRRRLPRPLPILLEDLYAPAARLAYRSLRDWEEDMATAVHTGAVEDSDLLDEVAALARRGRRYLMQVQRLRHHSREAPRDMTLRSAWETHHIDWSGFLLTRIEQLMTLTQALLNRTGGASMTAERETLREIMTQLERELVEHLRAVDTALASGNDEAL